MLIGQIYRKILRFQLVKTADVVVLAVDNYVVKNLV